MKNFDDHLFMHQGAKPELFTYAKKNRESNTKAEKILWEQLKLKRLDGYKFRNQHPLGPYIVDFYCHAAKIVIEVDGGYHEQEEQKQYDEGKSFDIEATGIKVLRFTNEEVMNSLPEVLKTIRCQLRNDKSPDDAHELHDFYTPDP